MRMKHQLTNRKNAYTRKNKGSFVANIQTSRIWHEEVNVHKNKKTLMTANPRLATLSEQ